MSLRADNNHPGDGVGTEFDKPAVVKLKHSQRRLWITLHTSRLTKMRQGPSSLESVNGVLKYG